MFHVYVGFVQKYLSVKSEVWSPVPTAEHEDEVDFLKFELIIMVFVIRITYITEKPYHI